MVLTPFKAVYDSEGNISKSFAGFNLTKGMSLDKDIAALKEFNNAIDTGMSKQDAFDNYLSGTSVAAQNAANAVGKGKVNIQEFATASGVASAKVALFNAALNVGIILAVSLAIKGLTWAFDKMFVTLEEQKQIVSDLNDEYEDLTSQIKSAEDELASVAKRIKELNSDSHLTLIEKSELDNLNLSNDELNTRIELLKKEQEITAKKRAEAVKTEYEKDMVDDGIEYESLYKTHEVRGYGQSFDIASSVSEEEHIGELIRRMGELNQLRASGVSLTEKELKEYEDYSKELTDAGVKYSDWMSEYDIDDETRQHWSEMAETIVKTLDLSKWKAEQFSDFFNSDSLKNTKSELIELAKSGKLSESTLGEYKEFDDLMATTGLTAAEIIEEIRALSGVTISYTQTSAKDWSEFNDTLDTAVSSYSTLSSAMDELSDSGNLSIGTLQSLINGGLIQYLEVVNGKLQINKTALDEVSNSAKYSAIASLQNAMAKDIEALATGKVEEISNTGKIAIGGFSDNLKDVGDKAKSSTGDLYGFVSAELAAVNAVSGNFDSENQLQDFMTEANKIRDAYAQIGQSVFNTDFGAAKSSNNQTDKWKEAFESAYSEIEYLRDMDQISAQDYYNKLSALDEKYYAGRDKYIEEHRKNLKELYSLQKELFDDYTNDTEHQIFLLSNQEGTEKQRIALYQQLQDKIHEQADKYRAMGLDDNHEYIQDLQKQWWNYADEIKDINDSIIESAKETMQESLELAIKLQEEKKDQYDDTVSAVVDVIDKQISALEDEKSALQELKEEREDSIKLAELENDLLEAQNDLLNARTQKTVRIFTNGEWIWTTDKDKVKDAEEAVKDAKEAIKDFKFDQQIDEIDKQIESWEDYKDEWTSVADNYETEENRLHASQILGANWEKNILKQRTSTLQTFADDYLDLMNSIASSQSQLDSLGSGSATDAVINQMKSNSEKWHGASEELQQAYSDANKNLGDSLGWSRDDNTGIWYDENGARAYAEGTLGSVGKYHIINDGFKNGIEALVTPNGTVTSLPNSTGVISADKTKFLTDFASNPLRTLSSFINPALYANTKTTQSAASVSSGTTVQNMNINYSGTNFKALLTSAEQYIKTHKPR